MTDTGDRRGLLRDALVRLRQLQARLDELEQERGGPIAIVGMSCRLPHADGVDQFWQLLKEGGDGVERASARHGDGWVGALELVDRFDAGCFGISASEATHLDPQQRLALELAWEALDDAGQVIGPGGARAGVFLGAYQNDYLLLQLGNSAHITTYTAPGNAHSILANRVSYTFDLHGPSLTVDTACSSSLVAVHLACLSLRAGECDLALAGGINLILSPVSTAITSKVLPIAADGHCKAFDAAADGIVRGEGGGMVVLKRLSDAVAAHDRVLAVVRGSAINQDGRSNGLTAPNPLAQRDLLRAALRQSGVEADQVGYVEAHGTGTALGDPIEVEALASVYGAGAEPCAVGAVKTNIGHLEAAAGIAGLIKTVLVLRHAEIPPTLHLRQISPHVELDGTRLYIPTQLEPWRGPRQLRRAAVSSFGFGGTNAHVIVEQAPVSAQGGGESDSLERSYVLPLSARSTPALEARVHQFRELLATQPAAASVHDICSTAAVRRTHHTFRTAVHGRTAAELAQRLDRAAGASRPVLGGTPRVALVFSGQVGEAPEMLRELGATFATCRDSLDGVVAEVERVVGWNLLERISAEPDRAEVVQLGIFALQVALAALWRSWGMLPEAVVGHSLGEVAAAHVAGILDLQAAVGLLLHRAQVTERVHNTGGLLVAALDEVIAQALVADEPDVDVAAVNGPQSTVLSGDTAVLARLAQSLRGQRIAARMLTVKYPFHSAKMESASWELARRLGRLEPAAGTLAYYSTVTGNRLDGQTLDADYWRRNLRGTVRFADAIAATFRHGYNVFIEVGQHSVLSADVAACAAARSRAVTVVPGLRRGRDSYAALCESLCELYAAGCDVDWHSVYPNAAHPVDLPAYPWQRSRFWLDQADPRVEPPLPTGTPRLQLANLPAEQREAQLTAFICQRIARALDVDDDEALVTSHTPLDGVGLDSLMVVELRNQLEKELNVALPMSVLLSAPSPAVLARMLSLELERKNLELPADEAVALLARVDELTEAEVDAALNALLTEPATGNAHA